MPEPYEMGLTAEDIRFPDEHPCAQMDEPKRTVWGQWVDRYTLASGIRKWAGGVRYC